MMFNFIGELFQPLVERHFDKNHTMHNLTQCPVLYKKSELVWYFIPDGKTSLYNVQALNDTKLVTEILHSMPVQNICTF